MSVNVLRMCYPHRVRVEVPNEPHKVSSAGRIEASSMVLNELYVGHIALLAVMTGSGELCRAHSVMLLLLTGNITLSRSLSSADERYRLTKGLLYDCRKLRIKGEATSEVMWVAFQKQCSPVK